MIGAQTGISNNVEEGKKMFGSPAMEITKFHRSYVVFRNLPELRNDVETLKRNIAKQNKNPDN
jgi:UDP-3-O-[3-hydroxymyristoyl] glucosamine N-acyltransferase